MKTEPKGLELEDDSIPSARPDEFVPVGVDGLMAATRKVLAINRGLAGPDHRDGIQFKSVMTTADLLAECISLDSGKALSTALRHAARHRSLKGLPPGFLDDNLDTHLTGNPLSSPSEEVNPLDVGNQQRRVTLMGPGGISSSDMVSVSMQAVHPSQFGFISPVEGPESENAGIDTRLANGVMIGSNGRIYQKFLNPRTGSYHWLAPEDLVGKTVGLPNQT